MARTHLTVTLHLEPSSQFDMIARILGYVRTGDPSEDDLTRLNDQLDKLGIRFGEGKDGDDEGGNQ